MFTPIMLVLLVVALLALVVAVSAGQSALVDRKRANTLSDKVLRLSIDLARADKHDLTDEVKRLEAALVPFADAGAKIKAIHDANVAAGGPGLAGTDFGFGMDFEEFMVAHDELQAGKQ